MFLTILFFLTAAVMVEQELLLHPKNFNMNHPK